MAIGFDFIAAIVRINALDDKYPGGLKACLNHWRARDIHLWHDDFLLFGGGTMSGQGVPDLIGVWQDMGLDTHSEEDGQITQWRDICVCEVLSDFPLWNCQWLLGNTRRSGVYLAGTPPGTRVYRPPYPLDDEIVTAAKVAEEEVINLPLRVARAAEEARLDALGLPAEERNRRLNAWIKDFIARNTPFIERYRGPGGP